MKFLQENSGQSSSTRLIFFIGALWCMLLVTLMAFRGAKTGELVILYSSIMGVLVGLKLGQKPMEGKK